MLPDATTVKRALESLDFVVVADTHLTDTATLAVVTLNLQQLGDPTLTAALAVGLTGVVAAAALPLVWVWRGSVRIGAR